MIAFIWAQDRNGIIGKDGKLPWHLRDDLQLFKQRTLGQILLMGRKTYDGMPTKPLPGRTNVVLTRKTDFNPDGCVVVNDRQAALDYAAKHPDQQLFIGGGSEVFKLFADDADTLYITRLAGAFDGDTEMPKLNWNDFVLDDTMVVPNADPQLSHVFETWRRKK
ncbi:dihydrofolate reductase [Lacticaseibacillus pabuli]|uniref:Dihydrofolate reductase n=1 Tax=Lacticaseibacillus pabuli TaxID=3025672 RepID=A0ABY7WTD5_9LACO|nr:dihydrofolate reductase [Lacticaseibacillus sp. KACC 23028]WDF82299.1 dihydrofolate reductase [Lacticaseibacillus sp. KACC 23028]